MSVCVSMLMKPYLLPRVKNTSVGVGNDGYRKYCENDKHLLVLHTNFPFFICISNTWMDSFSSDSDRGADELGQRSSEASSAAHVSYSLHLTAAMNVTFTSVRHKRDFLCSTPSLQTLVSFDSKTNCLISLFRTPRMALLP